MLLLIELMYNICVVSSYASIVKWISRRSSEPLLGVRIPLDAQKYIKYSMIKNIIHKFYKRHRIHKKYNICPFAHSKNP